MKTGPPARHCTVLVAAVPEAVAAAATEALRPHSVLLLRAVPSLETLKGMQPPPDLILMGRGPDESGPADLLRDLKQDPDCRRVPVLVGAPDWPTATLQAHYRLHANACLAWPEGPDARAWLVRIARFWLGGAAILVAPIIAG